MSAREVQPLDTIPFRTLVRYIVETPLLADVFEKRSGISRDVLKSFATDKTIPELITLVNRVSKGESLQLTDELQGGLAPFVWVFAVGMMYVADVLRSQTPFQAIVSTGSVSYISEAESALASYGSALMTLQSEETQSRFSTGLVDYATYHQAVDMTNAQIGEASVFIKAEGIPLMLTLNGNTSNALQTIWQLGSPQQVDALLQSYYQTFTLVSDGNLDAPTLRVWSPAATALLTNGELSLPAPLAALPAPLPTSRAVSRSGLRTSAGVGPRLNRRSGLSASAGVGPRLNRPAFQQFKTALVGANISNPEDPRTQILTTFAPLITTYPTNASSPVVEALKRQNITVTFAARVITDSSWSPTWMAGILAVIAAGTITSLFSKGLVYSYLFSRTGINYAATYAYAGDNLVTYQYGIVNGRPPGWYLGANQSYALSEERIQTIPRVLRDEVVWKTAAGAGTPEWPWRSYKEVTVPAKWKDDLDALVPSEFNLLTLFSYGRNAEYAVTTGWIGGRQVYYDYEGQVWKFQNHVLLNEAIPRLLQLEVAWKTQQGAGRVWRKGTYKKPRATREYVEWMSELRKEYTAEPALRNAEVPWMETVKSYMPALDIGALWKRSYPTVPLQPLEFYPLPTTEALGTEALGINTTEEGRLSAVDVYERERARPFAPDLEARVFREIEAIEQTNTLILQRIGRIRAHLNR